MLKASIFSSVSDLMALTGIDTSEGLWDAGFNIDDWDIGFALDRRIHAVQKQRDEDTRYDELELEWNGSAPNEDCVLVTMMNQRWGGTSYCEHRGRHYYIVHH